MKYEKVTDHDLLKLADDWHESTDYINIGLRTAFAAGYRLAEQQVSGLCTKTVKDLEEKIAQCKKLLSEVKDNCDADAYSLPDEMYNEIKNALK